MIVPMAAPSNPNSGQPRWPNISTQLATTFTNSATVFASISTFVLPIPVKNPPKTKRINALTLPNAMYQK